MMSKFTVQALIERMKALPSVFGGGIIAGGYVRDTALGMPVKDIDVFVGRGTRPSREMLEGTGFKRVRDAEYGRSDYIWSVYRDDTTYELPVEVIFTSIDARKFVVDCFDWNICKCWYDYTTDETVYTDKFMADADMQRCTLEYNAGRHVAYSVLEHGHRLVDKLGWPMRLKYVD